MQVPTYLPCVLSLDRAFSVFDRVWWRYRPARHGPGGLDRCRSGRGLARIRGPCDSLDLCDTAQRTPLAILARLRRTASTPCAPEFVAWTAATRRYRVAPRSFAAQRRTPRRQSSPRPPATRPEQIGNRGDLLGHAGTLTHRGTPDALRGLIQRPLRWPARTTTRHFPRSPRSPLVRGSFATDSSRRWHPGSSSRLFPRSNRCLSSRGCRSTSRTKRSHTSTSRSAGSSR